MDEKAREARRAYKREWYKKNRDKARASMEKYWTRKAEQAERAAEAERQAQEDSQAEE